MRSESCRGQAPTGGQEEQWENLLLRVYAGEVTRELIGKEVERFERAEQQAIFGLLSDYTLTPYLAIKGAVRTNVNFVPDAHDYRGTTRQELVEISALLNLWRKLMC